ncbi:MAG TPA: HupE/UreJ family protein [Nannocystaceae bacterium]|nr:HupE/UreJ family protein [Nannocystaceae bacterium]
MIRRTLATLLLAVLASLASLASSTARAHGLHPGVLTLVEGEPGVFTIAWTEPMDTVGLAAPVEIEFPAPCRRTGDVLDCGPAGLRGTIAFRGLDAGRAQVMTLVRFGDGREVEAMVTGDDPSLALAESPGRSALAWLRLGVEHILGGLDHLAFVLGLLLVIGTEHLRRLVATITAFTVAHSITLVLAATGVLVLPSAPVEATIAASVVLVAREALDHRPTLTRRAPWVIAFVFGLVHGLGFAGALADWGLPEGWIGRSLLFFNVGVELGQLAVVVVTVAIVRRFAARLAPLAPVAAYAIGGLAAWWLIERTLAVMAGS